MGTDSKAVKAHKKHKATRDDAQDHAASLPDHLREQRQYVSCGPNLNYNVSLGNSAHLYSALGINNSWSFEDFQQELKVDVRWVRHQDMEFDIAGIEPAIANALRRILIAELPTMAIEHVFIVNNTSIIACEVLSHRLGLVPIKVDPHLFQDKTGDETSTEANSIVFKLNVRCKREGSMIVNEKVTSGQLMWLPHGSEMPQETNCRFALDQGSLLGSGGPRLVHDDILLAKLRPGQEIALEAHCTRGTGEQHAKWSPVATAWYRLWPEVLMLEPVVGEKADKLAAACPGLFTVKGTGKGRTAMAGEAQRHPQLLEKVRRLSGEDEWRDHLQLHKRKDHFICTIESTGILRPQELFVRALDILAAKCDKLLDYI